MPLCTKYFLHRNADSRGTGGHPARPALRAALRVSRDNGGTEPEGDFTLSCGNGNADHLNTDFSLHKGIILAVGRVQSVSDRMS
jgi:hypothetical protein